MRTLTFETKVNVSGHPGGYSKVSPVQTQMARRKFRSNQRHEPTTERSFQEYVLSSPAQQTSRTELLRLVRGGEDTFLELKVKLSNTEKVAQEIIALANTGGGLIVFGVNDQLRVEGVDDAEGVREELVRMCREQIVPRLIPYIDCVAFDSGKRVVALEVDGKQRPYRTREGRYYIRVGAEKREASRDELSALLDEARPVFYENVPAIGAKLADIDEAHFWSYIREFEGDAFTGANGGGFPTGETLERDLLLGVNGGSEIVPTVAGLLLFGLDERVGELLPRSSVHAVRFAGDAPQSPQIERVQLTGNLHTLYDSVMRFVMRYCDMWEARPRTFPGADRGEGDPVALPRGNYHLHAISEGVANALVHRDLALREQQTRVHVFDHSIEIVNPRRTQGFAPAAQRAIRYGMPQRLNPQLAAVFSSSAYGLNLPHGGLPSLLRNARLFAGRRPEINSFNDEFRLRIFSA